MITCYFSIIRTVLNGLAFRIYSSNSSGRSLISDYFCWTVDCTDYISICLSGNSSGKTMWCADILCFTYQVFGWRCRTILSDHTVIDSDNSSNFWRTTDRQTCVYRSDFSIRFSISGNPNRSVRLIHTCQTANTCCISGWYTSRNNASAVFNYNISIVTSGNSADIFFPRCRNISIARIFCQNSIIQIPADQTSDIGASRYSLVLCSCTILNCSRRVLNNVWSWTVAFYCLVLCPNINSGNPANIVQRCISKMLL